MTDGVWIWMTEGGCGWMTDETGRTGDVGRTDDTMGGTGRIRGVWTTEVWTGRVGEVGRTDGACITVGVWMTRMGDVGRTTGV